MGTRGGAVKAAGSAQAAERSRLRRIASVLSLCGQAMSRWNVNFPTVSVTSTLFRSITARVLPSIPAACARQTTVASPGTAKRRDTASRMAS